MAMIRTDPKAFGLSAALAAAFFFFCLRVGALDLPDAMRTYDRLAIWLALGATAYSGLFFVGHRLLRRAGTGARAAYAALGAGTLAGIHTSLNPGATASALQSGTWLINLALPIAFGAVFGFLYAFRAGWDAEPASVDLPTENAGALIEADGETYFDGPVRVRTVVPLMLLSAVFAAMLAGLTRGVMLVGWEVSNLSVPGWRAALNHAGGASGYAWVELAALIIIGAPAMTVMILAGHYVARGLKRTGGWAYFTIGLVMPTVLSLATMFLFLPIALIITVPTALGMTIYRRLAGLEPLPVREDILSGDPRHLVGVDHARRRYGRVIGARPASGS